MSEDKITLHERIKAIEVELDHLVEDGDKRSEELEKLNSKLDTLNTELARYRGFVGGILLVATAVLSFFKFFWADIVRFFKG